MIAECANLLFQLPEGAFDPEPVTVKPDDRQRLQCQAGACQDALDAIHFHQHKPQLLIKLLPPQQVNAVVTDGIPSSHKSSISASWNCSFWEVNNSFRRTAAPFLGGRPLPGFRAGFFICCAGFLCLGNDLHVRRPAAVKCFQLFTAGTVRKYLSSRSRQSQNVRAA